MDAVIQTRGMCLSKNAWAIARVHVYSSKEHTVARITWSNIAVLINNYAYIY